MIGTLKTVLVRKPSEAFGKADPVQWHYTSKPDLPKALKEHEALVKTLIDAGVTPIFHNAPLPNHADAIFVHDPVIITNFGAILLRMGKTLRQGEEAAIKETLVKLGIPIFYEMEAPGMAEGGDMFWLDPQTLIIGRGFRTNQHGIYQLQKLLAKKDIQVLAYDLPYDQGSVACLHMQSLISLVDTRLALVYLKLLPVALYNLLQERGFALVHVPDEEFSTLGPNFLAIRPGLCLGLQGNKVTLHRLEKAGCQVLTYKGEEISYKAEGGATCLTRPIYRLE